MSGQAAPGQGARGEAPSRSDLALYRKAVRERWPIDPAKRPAIVEEMVRLVEAPGADGPSDDDAAPAVDHRTRVAAAKVLLEMDRLNLEQEKRDLEIPDRVIHEHHFAELSDAELVARAAELARRAAAAGPPPAP
jgi:hypothetical protein